MKSMVRDESRVRIMIVEDEEDILVLYKDYLKRKGYSVIVSSTIADEIIDDFRKYTPDITVIDYKLPGKKTGLEAAKEILFSFPSARIIIITAFPNVKSEIKQDMFFDDKNVDLLIKPVKLVQLADAIVNA
jgi:DNA-binding response OmpR family regulator